MKLNKYIFIPLLFCLTIIISCSESMPLKEYKDATALRDKAIRYDLQNYSKEQFDIAEASYSEAIILIDENKDSAKVKDLLTTASNSYQTVLNEGLPQYAEVLKNEIDLERVYSKEVKAYRVDKDNYEFAELNYINALSALSTNNYEEAVNCFLNAKKYHHKAYFTTKVRYDESTRGIKEAEDKIKQVDELDVSYSK
ncbi:hypothetical protein BFL38_11975 [Brachyspira hampsonii]|uniref:Lipoprotein n=1 Tax=Brachyspira hampsonii TaxID=1287055 RepID=A0A1E5NIZ4_9SPIR|nr:hypothetical protein [Brachyspira hampsonii]OEJ16152.1 hypothetical protein BFL38_11975 [Brachyspira hampsonii]